MSQKSPAPSPPACPQLPPTGKSSWEFPAMGTAQPSALNIGHFSCSLCKGRSRSLRFYGPSNNSLQCWGEAGGGTPLPCAGTGEGRLESVRLRQGHK